jgi:hypothetical protein
MNGKRRLIRIRPAVRAHQRAPNDSATSPSPRKQMPRGHSAARWFSNTIREMDPGITTIISWREQWRQVSARNSQQPTRLSPKQWLWRFVVGIIGIAVLGRFFGVDPAELMQLIRMVIGQ